MSSAARHSTRLLLDLQACQTVGSAHRGVGRYSLGLTDAIAAAAAPRDVRLLLSDGLPHQPSRLPVGGPRIAHLPALPEWHSTRDFQGGERDSLDALAYSAFVQRLQPDVLHVSHVFEGLGDRVPLPDPSQRAPGQVLSATLYDLIPLIHRDHYFSLPGLEPWYHARTAWLLQADLLLAISEATRQDAIRLLGIDPSRVVAVHGGIAANFRPPVDRAAALRDLQARHAVRDRFLLYTGGDDYRKNLDGAIKGFAGVPQDVRRDLQLVIVCAMPESRREHFATLAKRSGLDPRQLLITGFVSEEDLVAFYGTCELFVFPSLYEGLGLPVLEAMACGAPAVGGDNSSIREIIARPDALFDATSPASIAEHLTTVLRNQALREHLREHGLARARQYTWARSAALALEAMDEALDRSRGAGVQAAMQGWVPRRRLAVHSPLPPRRSGIADYNAHFLPYLSRHFDIDLYTDGYAVDGAALNAAFRIFDVRDFERVAHAYDAILYEFGNSEYHVTMPELLERFPGVVGLHDAYLSGLFRYMAAVRGRPDLYHAEMLSAHGPRARRILAPVRGVPDLDEVAMVELPCTKRILDGAIGLVSHSPFNLDLAREQYPEGWPAPYRTIAQMVPVPPAREANAREAIRRELGFGADDFIVTTFGHVAWTKWGDRLLAGFLDSSLRTNAATHLVFAGEISKDTFGAELESAVRRSGLGDRVRITGYLSDDEYERYVVCTDMAVQLRTKSRGGTPKGVLDCLARGVPVAVNNDASYVDYPDDVVIKLPPEPRAADIAALLERAHAGREWLGAHARTGLEYVRAHHAPAQCAAEYAAAIESFTAQARLTRESAWSRSFAPRLAGTADPDAALQAAVSWLRGLPRAAFRRRRILIDVSHIVQSDHQTGVPRVVKQLVRAMMCTQRAGVEPMAVALGDGGLVVPRAWLAQQGLLLEHERIGPEAPVAIERGDIVLMLDSSWGRYREFHPVFAAARAARATIVTAIYDLLPILLPPGNIGEGGREWFEAWARDAITQSDGLACISRAVADQVIAYAHANALARPGLSIGWWHLGGDFARQGAAVEVSQRVRDAVGSPYLLMIGTIEPRKCHAQALDAMETLWAQGETLHLVVAGKEGWLVDELMRRLRSHPRLGQQLFLVEQPTDAEVAALYDQAAGLLFLSRGEGFGLPLVEAANHGTPILCSDLPVFHEVAGVHATYVEGEDPASLAPQIAAWWSRRREGDVPDSRNMPRLTWEQSGEALMDVIAGDNWYWTGAAGGA
jgi:glycosyltransferase involved in cell wall biosynthesis